ncbi:MAG: hypothetical protein RIC95_10650 [Vicingaceae bacterium]
MTGRIQLGADVLSADINEEDYNEWALTTYSSFDDFRNRVEGISKFPDLFRSFYCTEEEAKELESYFAEKGMKIEVNPSKMNNVRGLLLLKIG